MAGGATGLGRSTGQRDDPAGRNRVLGEDRRERKGKDLTCGSGLEVGEARGCGVGERSARLRTRGELGRASACGVSDALASGLSGTWR